MKATYGDDCPSESMIRKCFSEFEKGRETIFDLPLCRRPKLFQKVNDVKNAIDDFPFTSCRYIASIVDIDKNTLKRILIEDLHMKKVLYIWVPNVLTESQKKNRVEVSKQLLSILPIFISQSSQ